MCSDIFPERLSIIESLRLKTHVYTRWDPNIKTINKHECVYFDVFANYTIFTNFSILWFFFAYIIIYFIMFRQNSTYHLQMLLFPSFLICSDHLSRLLTQPENQDIFENIYTHTCIYIYMKFIT